MHHGGRREEPVRRKKLAALVCLLELHPCEVRADLQRFFGLNLDDLGRTFGALHAACCVANLPAQAATWAAWRGSDPRTPAGDALPDLGAVTVDEWDEWRSQDFEEVGTWREEA